VRRWCWGFRRCSCC